MEAQAVRSPKEDKKQLLARALLGVTGPFRRNCSNAKGACIKEETGNGNVILESREFLSCS